MAQGQVYRLKPGGLGLTPGSASPAVNLGKLPDLSCLGALARKMELRTVPNSRGCYED